MACPNGMQWNTFCPHHSLRCCLQAGNLAAGHMGLGAGELVLPAEADESHIRQAKQAAATARMLGDALLRVPGVLGLPLPLRS